MMFLLAILVLWQAQTDQSSQVRLLAERLQSDNIAEREAASTALIKLGKVALPEVELATQSKDIDLAARARKILAAIRAQVSEETFKKIEESIEKAKTVSIRIKYDWYRKNHEEAKRFRGSGTLLFKEGNKISLTLNGLDRDEKEIENVAICDGSTLAFRGQLWQWGPGEGKLGGEKGVKDIFATVFARGGAAFAMDCWRLLPHGREKLANAAEFSAIGEDKGGMTLSYKLTSSLEAGVTIDVKLWYDPKDFKLLKRTLEIKGEKTVGSFTETYDEFVLNTDIPDEKFAIPEEKK